MSPQDFYETLTLLKPDATVQCSDSSCGLLMDAQDALFVAGKPYCYDHEAQAQEQAAISSVLDHWLEPLSYCCGAPINEHGRCERCGENQ